MLSQFCQSRKNTGGINDSMVAPFFLSEPVPVSLLLGTFNRLDPLLLLCWYYLNVLYFTPALTSEKCLLNQSVVVKVAILSLCYLPASESCT